MRTLILNLAIGAVAGPATAQEATKTVDLVINDPRVPSLQPYGLNLQPQFRADKEVQYGHALRVPTQGHADFWRVGVVTPTIKPVRKGDRIVIAFWARAVQTRNDAPSRIGRVQLKASPVIRTIFEKPFDVGREWKMYQLAGNADQDYAPGGLNAALHLDSVRQVLDIGPIFILDYGTPK